MRYNTIRYDRFANEVLVTTDVISAQVFLAVVGRIAAVVSDSDLLLQTQQRGLSVCLSVCQSVGHVREPCKNCWNDRDAVWGADTCRSKEVRITWGRGRTNPLSAATGDKTTMRPFVQKSFDRLLLMPKTRRMSRDEDVMPRPRHGSRFSGRSAGARIVGDETSWFVSRTGGASQQDMALCPSPRWAAGAATDHAEERVTHRA